MTIAVLGGGPAGAAAAALLAAAGEDVTVLERDAAPADKVCGDFISVEAQAALRDLGLDPAALGAAPIRIVRLHHGARQAEAVLPFPALGLSRRRLDAALLDLAAGRGATVRRGVRVQALRPDGAVDTTEGTLRPRAVFLATGKHDLRGAARPAGTESWVGYKTYLTLTPEQAAMVRGAVELVLFDGGYAGLLAVEGGAVNMSLIVSTTRLAEAGGDWAGLLRWLAAASPALHARLAGAEPLRDRPVAVARLPYGFLHAAVEGEAAWRVGDQLVVIPSLTGDGVALALHTASRAVAAWRAGLAAAAHHAALHRELRGQMRRAAWLHRICLAAPAQGAVVRAADWLPGLVRLAASSTRIAVPTQPRP